MPTEDNTSYIDIQDAAELTGYSVKHLRKLARLGLITSKKNGKEIRVAWPDVQRLATQQKPFWVTLPDSALQSNSPDPRLLLHEHDASQELPAERFYDKIEVGDCIDWMRQMPSGLIQTVVTSPPYWGVRSYPGEIATKWADGSTSGLGEEPTVEGYVGHSLEILRHLKRVLRDDGTIWWNLGDTYQTRAYLRSSSTERLRAFEGDREDLWRNYPNKRYSSGHSYLKDKDLTMVPLLVALGAQHLGFYVRSVLIWYKSNTGVESVKDRPSITHEYILLLAKSRFYKYHAEKAVEESKTGEVVKRLNGKDEFVLVKERSLRSVWEFSTSNRGNHAAAFPLELPIRCIQISTDPGDLVFDPFAGSGTTLMAARMLGRHYFGCDILEQYVQNAKLRLTGPVEEFRATKVSYRGAVKPSSKASRQPRLLEGKPEYDHDASEN